MIVDGTFSNVFIHQESKDSKDELNCLTQPLLHKCNSLHYVIKTILDYNLRCIDSVYVQDHVYSAVEDVVLIRSLSANRHLTIRCSQNCNFTGNFAFVSRQMHPSLHISFINVQFDKSRVSIQNVHLELVSLHFVNSTVQDSEPRAGEKGEVRLSCCNVTFLSGILNVVKVFSSHISFSNSIVGNTDMYLQAISLFFMVNNSKISRSYVNLNVVNFTSVRVMNSTVQLSSFGKSAFLLVVTRCLEIHVTQSSVYNTSGGISVKILQSLFIPSWLQMTLQWCHFQSAMKSTSGGSLNIQYFHPSTKWSISNFVQILNTTFSDNKVIRNQLQNAYGGAVSIVSDRSSSGASLFVEIQNFLENHASDGGGALYVSGTFIELTIVHSYFYVSGVPQFPSKPLFVLSYTKISIESSTFVVPSVVDETLLNDLQVLSSAVSINNLTLTFKCPAWHWLEQNSDFGTSSVSGQTALQKITMKCASCPPGYYFYSDGSFVLTYKDQDIVKIQGQNSGTNKLKCLECPYGASCPGDDLKAKPNFWGYEMTSGISFVQCPSGYCCSGADSNPCLEYRSCFANRNGVLCGACLTNFSLSLLSNSCIPNEECDDQWFWLAAVLVTVFYMLWYTFKENIMSWPHYFVGKFVLHSKSKKQHSFDDILDRGHFGILIYFVQAMTFMRIEMQSNFNRLVDKVLQFMTMYVSLFLTIEVKYFSQDICPNVNVDTILKTRLKFLFYCGIFASWFVMFISLTIFTKCFPVLLETIVSKRKMVHGLVEIIKYTYGGLTDVVFYSLAYTTISGENVWLFDGTVKYFSGWQFEMFCFATFYTIPFPFVLFLGLKLLRMRQVSNISFLCSMFLPLPSILIYIMLIVKQNNKAKQNEQASVSMGENHSKVFDMFQGSYKEIGISQYWECIVILRRLLLGSTALIQNAVIKETLCVAMCLIFLVHHEKVQPFSHSISNKAERMSLFLLCIVAFVNGLKAVFIHLGVSALDDEMVHNLSLLESVFLPVLLLYILLMEITHKFRKRKATINKYFCKFF